MKRFIISIILCVFSFASYAQIYTEANRIDPKFPGGTNALMTFMKQNLKYPKECVENYITGRVLVSFVVDTNGKIKNIRVLKSVHPLLDKEACRVISIMPTWEPGMENGKPVNVQYTIPVTFTLPVPKASDSQIAHILEVSKLNENQTQDPKGLYRLMMFSYKDKAPIIPPFEQYKYLGPKSVANFALYTFSDSISIIQTRTDGFSPLKYTGKELRGEGGKGARVFNSGSTGFTFSWYCRGNQNNKELFPDNSYIDEWYNNKEGISEKVERIVSLCEMKLTPVKGNKLIGCWHRVGLVTKVGKESFLTKRGDDVYNIYDNDVMLSVKVNDANAVMSNMTMVNVNYDSKGKNIIFGGNAIKVKWEDKNTHKLILTKDDGTEVTEIWARSGLPAKFQELFGTNSDGSVK